MTEPDDMAGQAPPPNNLPKGMPPIPPTPAGPEEPPLMWMPGESIHADAFQGVMEAAAMMFPPVFPIDGRYASLTTLRRVDLHFRGLLGRARFLVHRLANDGLPLELIVYRSPIETHMPTLVVTAGLSDLTLAGPFPYRELVMMIPNHFALGQEVQSNSPFVWPYEVLRKIAYYSAVSRTPVWEGNSLSWGPLFPGSRFRDLYVMGYPDFDLYLMHRDASKPLRYEPVMQPSDIDSQNTVFMHLLVPILPDEVEYLKKFGPAQLTAKLQELGLNSWYDPARPSCLAPKGNLPANLPPIPAGSPAKPKEDSPTWHWNVDVQSPEFAAQCNNHYARLETIRYLVKNTPHLGSPVHLFHPGTCSQYLRMEILVFQPPDRPGVLLTAGFSDLPFPMQVEYAMVLPPGWPLDEESLKQPQYDWPFKTLLALTIYSAVEKKFIVLGQTFDPNLPPDYRPEQFQKWFIFFMNPPLPVRGKQPTIIFQPIPIYPEEFDFIVRKGDHPFGVLLEKEFTELDPAVGRNAFYDFKRRNIAPQPSKPSWKFW